MALEKVLICGAGVSGSVLAYWLAQAQYEVVVIERSRAEQKLGQGIEIEQPAIKVVEAMGIFDSLQARRTDEAGFELFNERNQSYGALKNDGLSPTGALEMMRGDLTDILYKAADESPHVTYRFETTIQSLRQTEDKVMVELERRSDKTVTTEEFVFVIGADGSNSRTRDLAFGTPTALNCFHRIGAYVAYFSIPEEPQDMPYSRLCHFPERRVAWVRPVAKGAGQTSVYLIKLSDNIPKLRAANAARDRQAQKEAIAEVFHGASWETPRIIKGMLEAENFYSDELVQVKLKKWAEHRVALTGDAAWAPTPFTGQGNQLAIIGAWVLAQEMSRDRSTAAFAAYEKRLREYVETSQAIPLHGWAPRLAVPETSVGIAAFRAFYTTLTWIVHFVKWTGLASYMPDGEDEVFDLQISRGMQT